MLVCNIVLMFMLKALRFAVAPGRAKNSEPALNVPYGTCTSPTWLHRAWEKNLEGSDRDTPVIVALQMDTASARNTHAAAYIGSAYQASPAPIMVSGVLSLMAS